MCLRLEPTYGVVHREEPQLGRYPLEDSCLEFFHHFQLIEHSRIVLHEHELIAAIQLATNKAGRSTLEIAPVVEMEAGHDAYLFCLTTTLDDEETRHVFQYEEDAALWQDLLHSNDAAPWMTLLADLMDRVSDRAYLHVQQRLKTFGYNTHETLNWNTQPIKTFNELLALNMKRIENANGYEYLTPLQYLWKSSEKPIYVRLPCEHNAEVTLRCLASLSKHACTKAYCAECGDCIMSHENVEHGYHSLERRRRERHQADQYLWTRIEQEVDYAGLYINTTGFALVRAMHHALRSLQIPTSITPSGLHPSSSDEAAQVMIHMTRIAAVKECQVQALGEEIHESLAAEMKAALQELHGENEAPFPGWSLFSERWLERAVKLAATPGYDGEDVWQVYGEEVDENLVFADEDAEWNAEWKSESGIMEDIEDLMEQTTLDVA